MLRVVCASANPDKVREIEELLVGVVELLPRPAHVPDVVEDADTLLGNAQLKARALVAATGMPAVADDTGLEVDALGGAPGVRTARFAGDDASYADNRRHLLDALRDVAAAARTARFRTVVVLAHPDGGEVVTEGECRGVITAAERGERGFGYDAVFAPSDGDGRTFAEMTIADKHAMSHRGRAFRRLAELLAAER
ncbi:MAG: RdgB/HAM1 family non-canonical purine NTP pyrophosphatase [Ilumatobacteraceae bacterium]